MEVQAANSAAQIQAYVQYLRDLAIYDLYLRAEPRTVLPAAVRETLLREAGKRVAGGPADAPGSAQAP